MVGSASPRAGQVLAGACLALWSAVLAACPLDLARMELTVAGHPLSAEVARTPRQRGCGLSHRAAVPDTQGMLFVFPVPRHLSFWMKDTHIPLSIAFLDDQGVILDIQPMAPNQTRERYRSPTPARYALEVNQGWFEGRSIRVGDRVVFSVRPR
jgi:uncharacterized membrane protein (UPF0127 family)